ncbi:MAG: SpoIID/LytB domain-containing protein [Nitriliruptoraceae bacterium]
MPADRARGRRPLSVALRCVTVGLLGVLAGVGLPSAPAAALAPVTTTGTVRVVPDDGVLVEVDGTRYPGTIELGGDGEVVNEVELERYLEGVAEMPSRWPGAALEAQAVAARTYAWWSARNASHVGYDLCATTACQVYRGAEVVLDGGQRWADAVAATAGQVLLDDDGAPILARYFSTSGGRTFANEDVFPATGPRPYLVAIDDPFDEVSPYHRWEVRFDREDFDALLAEGQRLVDVVPVAEVERTGAVDDLASRLRFTGRDGTVVEVTPLEVRDFLNRLAPARFPSRYPSQRSDRLRPLPTTVPSTRFTIEVTDEEVVLDGRGWGHGVGLGQYGAQGRAAAGQDHETILAAYYGGLTPTTTADLPDTVRVGLGRREQVRLVVHGAARLETSEGEVVQERVVGRWAAAFRDGSWQLAPPAVAGDDGVIGPTREVSTLLGVRDAVTVEADVAVDALLSLEVTGPDGELVLTRDLGLAGPGTHAATWRLEDDRGAPVAAGTYRLALVGEDAAGLRDGTSVEVEVDTPGTDGRSDGMLPLAASGTLSPLLVLAVSVLALAGIFLIVRTSRSRP